MEVVIRSCCRLLKRCRSKSPGMIRSMRLHALLAIKTRYHGPCGPYQPVANLQTVLSYSMRIAVPCPKPNLQGSFDADLCLSLARFSRQKSKGRHFLLRELRSTEKSREKPLSWLAGLIGQSFRGGRSRLISCILPPVGRTSTDPLLVRSR
jgi:hypothetical protein